MIGVLADSSDHAVVREFFELFKTPWEHYRIDRQYDVLLCAGDREFDANSARLVLVYSGRILSSDGPSKVVAGEGQYLAYKEHRIPIYGRCVTSDESAGVVVEAETGRVRLGYDIFEEIRLLLTAGQPADHAAIPTLDLHIAMLRDLIVERSIPLVEIPPVPEGYNFIACLTHDVDHPSIRQHGCDHTTIGFVYRATFGSLMNVIRGRTSVRDLLTNWLAVLRLPFVHLGLVKDFWSDFADRYLELEKGLRSTFFLIPFRDCPGESASGSAPGFRSAKYGAQDLRESIQKLQAAGCEVGLHGIDAWRDSANAQNEIEEIRRLTGVSSIGVRIHWLYYDSTSPAVLENAGTNYDSTIGYNRTVGYRAGTTQAYKPAGVTRLLELPLHVMDTALFYPSHLGLSQEQGQNRVNEMVMNAARLGGCLTVNWHDRSTAPDRLWDASYRELLAALKSRRVWFATASQVVAWFRKRRSAVFETNSSGDVMNARITGDRAGNLPALRLRLYGSSRSGAAGSHSNEYIDTALEAGMEYFPVADRRGGGR